MPSHHAFFIDDHPLTNRSNWSGSQVESCSLSNFKFHLTKCPILLGKSQLSLTTRTLTQVPLPIEVASCTVIFDHCSTRRGAANLLMMTTPGLANPHDSKISKFQPCKSIIKIRLLKIWPPSNCMDRSGLMFAANLAGNFSQ